MPGREKGPQFLSHQYQRETRSTQSPFLTRSKAKWSLLPIWEKLWKQIRARLFKKQSTIEGTRSLLSRYPRVTHSSPRSTYSARKPANQPITPAILASVPRLKPVSTLKTAMSSRPLINSSQMYTKAMMLKVKVKLVLFWAAWTKRSKHSKPVWVQPKR